MSIRAIVVGGVIAFVLVFSGGCQDAGQEGPRVETVPVEEPAVTTEPVEPTPEVQPDQPPVPLRLTFVPGQTAIYKVTTEIEKSIAWEGDVSQKPKEFTGGATGSRIEITFDQQVEEVDEKGQGLLDVTIKSLTYLGRVRSKVVLDFDSSRAEDQDRPLAKLIGQSYKVKMTPKGMVLSMIDMAPIRQAVQGDLPENRTALRLLSDSRVKERHEVTALTCLDAETVSLEDRWSDVKKFSFDWMGLKAYERVYTLEKVSPSDGASVAVIEMEGVPSSALAAEMAQPQPTNPFAGMTDSRGSYDGRLDLNLDTGQVQRSVEALKVQWLMVDPSTAQNDVASPAVLRIQAKQVYELERLD